MGNVSPSSGYCCPVANGARHRSRPLQPRFETNHLTTNTFLWRGSLLPLGRKAAPKSGTAAQPSGSKLPHHSKGICSSGD
ncbi:hypothetical protein B7453_10335 [Pseudomonas sp. IB20]|nr:hypothetical protein B7453_10335 [Pseudomonas sp. IB20]